MRPSSARRVAALAVGIVAACAVAPRARACGCFAQPSPAEPVVQAGERLLFAHEDDQVIAYVQIRYQGRADQFAWLVPLPSVPTVALGSDELFGALDAGTRPIYRQSNAYCNSFYGGGGGLGCASRAFSPSNGTAGGGSQDAGVSFGEGDMGPSGVAVVQASIGPYDYAVLKADDGTAMFQWLSDNRFFVPTGTMSAVQPYLHPGAYFLALKLKGGESTGDIVPVELRYRSDLPMIPITLTQVSAVENLGVQVWLLGEARAIPRNYYHVVLDEMPIWFQANYNLQLIDAVHAAPGKHGFITEYAGDNGVRGVLDAPGRFGNLDELRTFTDPSAFLAFLRAHGFSFDGTLLSILARYIPEPPALVAAGVPLGTFYQQYDYYLRQLGGGDGDADAGVTTVLDAGACVDELAQRVVQPALDAGALIRRHSYLTRLYTALSPVDMTIDPVFSFNADLPTFSNVHDATLSLPCTGAPWLSTVDNGFEAQYVSGLPPSLSLPAAQRVELLREAGPPELVQDNTRQIRDALGPVEHGSLSSSSSRDGCGCAVGTATRVRGNLALLLLAAAGALVLRGLRRRRAT